jgi:hypothetical protein
MRRSSTIRADWKLKSADYLNVKFTKDSSLHVSQPLLTIFAFWSLTAEQINIKVKAVQVELPDLHLGVALVPSQQSVSEPMFGRQCTKSVRFNFSLYIYIPDNITSTYPVISARTFAWLTSLRSEFQHTFAFDLARFPRTTTTSPSSSLLSSLIRSTIRQQSWSPERESERIEDSRTSQIKSVSSLFFITFSI